MKIARCWLLCLACIQLNAFALGLDDFVPDFISSSSRVESANANPVTAFSIPEASQQRNAKSNESYWYCDKIHNPSCVKQASSAALAQKIIQPVSGSNVLNSSANQGANSQYYNRDGNTYNQNAINNFNITNSNQTAMQPYSAQLNNLSIEDKLKQNIAIPLKAGENTAVSVGTNNVQFNVSY